MLSPSEILEQLRENLKITISATGYVNCTSWSAPLKNGVKYQSTLTEIPIDFICDTDLMVKELYKITLDQLMEDANNGTI